MTTEFARYLPLAAAAGALLLAGCNGSGSGAPTPAPEPPPPPVAFDLPEGALDLAPTDGEPLEIAAGATARRGNVEFVCAAGGDACVVAIMSVAGDYSARTAAYEATGGKVTARAAREDITAPANHGVTDTVRVSAGATVTSGNANIACPAGGAGCKVVVEDGAVKYLATGGAPFLTPARADVTAPANHGVTGTVRISAGAAMRSGNVDIACPAGSGGCTVVVEGGAVKYLTTGGAPVLTAALERMTVPEGHGLYVPGDGPIRVAAGQTLTRGNVRIECPGGGADCVLHAVNAAGSGVSYEATGGAPTVAANGMALELPANHGLTAVGTRTIPAGGTSLRLGNVDISCPAGGRDCVVDVASNGGSATWRATGGAPTAAAAWDELTDPPTGHGLATKEIAAGETHYGPRGVSLTCPTGAACSVRVDDDGMVTYKATGGTPTVMTDEMILAANSGPNRKLSSDGGHAVGLITRIGTRLAAHENGRLSVHWDRGNNNPQGTLGPSVTTNAAWPANANSPNLGVSLGRDAFGKFAQTLPDTIPIDGSTLSRLEATPAEGWNGVVLKEDRGDSAGGTVVYAAVYSDIDKPTGGTPSTVEEARKFWDLSLASDSAGAYRFGDNRRLWAEQSVTDLPEVDDVVVAHEQAGIFNIDLTALAQDTSARIYFDFTLGDKRYRAETRSGDWARPIAQGGWVDMTVAQCIGPSNDRCSNLASPLSGVNRLTCVGGPSSGSACEAFQLTPEDGSLRGVWQLNVNTQTPREEPELDDHYLMLGAWMSLPEIEDGRFDAGVFANGNVPVAADTLRAMTGEAKYVGPATGIYARGVYGQAASPGQGRSGTPAVESAQIGSFSATTELTADFGAATELPRIRGFVNRFMENGSSLGDWTVQLDRTDAHDHHEGDNFHQMHGVVSGEADGRRLTGNWGAEFFESTVGAAEDDTNPHPGYVAGTFGAFTGSHLPGDDPQDAENTPQDAENTPQDLNALHILGAFGAERQ